MQAHSIEAIEILIAWLAWPALLHSLWTGLLAASVVALIFQTVTRLSHCARYRILLAALVFTILGPTVSALFLHPTLTRPSHGTEPDVLLTATVDARTLSPEMQTTSRTHVLSSRPKTPLRDRFAALFAICLAYLADALQQIRLFVLAAWLLGVALGTGFLALGAKAIHRLREEADPASERIQARARVLARRLRMKNVPSVLVHARIDEPFLAGLFRPAILLPGRCVDLTRADLLDSILSHELAHARRLDHLVNLAQRLVETLLFFHPGVHWLSRSLRRQREFCTDRLAVRVTRDPLALAKALESVALLRLSSPAPRLAGTSLGGQTTSLLPRIEELIGMKPSGPRPHVWPFAAIPAAGLIALVAASAGQAQDRSRSSSARTDAKAVPARQQESTSTRDQDTKRLISYEVRFISLDAEPWRHRAQDQLKLMQQEADVCAWIVNDEVIRDMLTFGLAQTTSNVLQAPKAVAPENVFVTLANESKQYYVAQVEKIDTDKSAAFRPIVKNIDVGVRMKVKGSLQARGSQLSVDVQAKDILAMHTLKRKDQVGDRIVAAQYQIPTPIERRCQLTCEIPESFSLVISMGVHERRGRSSDAVEAASEVLEFVGLPPVPARSVTCEQLVVITPRRVVEPAGKKSGSEFKPIKGS